MRTFGEADQVTQAHLVVVQLLLIQETSWFPKESMDLSTDVTDNTNSFVLKKCALWFVLHFLGCVFLYVLRVEHMKN